MWLAIGAAVGYSLTNLLLRRLSGKHPGMSWDILISAGKALPTAVTAWTLVLLKLRKGTAVFPSVKLFIPLFIAALVMQFGGNVGFQVALGHIGLAVTVPLVFACIICSGAFLGRAVLGDPITLRSLMSVAVMMIAIVMLSSAASRSATDMSAEHGDTTGATSVVFGILAAIVSGLSYGANGVVIRRYVRDKLPVESTLLVFGTTGIVMLGTISCIECRNRWPASGNRRSMGDDAAGGMLQCGGLLFGDVRSEADEHHPSQRYQCVSECNVCSGGRIDLQRAAVMY